MNCPPCPALEDLEAILSDIRQMNEATAQLRERLKTIPRKMAAELSDENQRLEAARYLYWLKPELSPIDIADGLLGITPSVLKKRIGKIPSEISCVRCSKPFEFRSRSHAKEITQKMLRAQNPFPRRPYFYSNDLVCDTCRAEIQEESYAESKRESEMYDARFEELRTMPYKLYLQTDEWRATRTRHLRSVGYSCQVCNASEVTIDVHHRTYERRGNELYTDLLALCRTCHGIFHREGKLAR